MELLLVVGGGAAVAPLALMLPDRRWRGLLLAVVPAAMFAYLLTLTGRTAAGEVVEWSTPWMPSLGIELAFRGDGLSLLFGLLITGIGALVLVYAEAYMAGKRRAGQLHALLLVFMAAMLGVVFADDVVTLFVAWELTSLASFFLISFEGEEAKARKAATQALLVTGAGGLALLAGLIILGHIAGTYRLAELTAAGETIRGSALGRAALGLVMVGAFAKSAQVPFHFWLPGAMVAPTPVSAYLHSATMVKAGVYLLARLHPAFGSTEEWTAALTVVGAVTMVVGAFVAIHERDMKLILAATTTGALGMMTLLLGMGTATALKAAMLFIVAHALYKGALFMVTGTIDRRTATP